MPNPSAPDQPAVHELRLVVTVDDYDAALAFYRDALGLPERGAFGSPDGGRVVILEAGQATLELADRKQAAYIDEVEVGRRVAGQFRVAFGVPDADGATRRLSPPGPRSSPSPWPRPWQTRNARLDAPGDLQLTLFAPGP